MSRDSVRKDRDFVGRERTIILSEWDSWGEYLEPLLSPAPATNWSVKGPGTQDASVAAEMERKRETEENRQSWDYATGYEGSIRLAQGLSDWPQGLSQVQRYSSAIFDSTAETIVRPQYSYDVEGGELDVARYLEGEPECFLQEERSIVSGVGGLVHIVVNGGVSGCRMCSYSACGYHPLDARTITARGAAIVALAELLEYSGKTVCIDLVYAIDLWSANSERLVAQWTVTLKPYEQPLDVPRATFALAHPGAFRRLGFRTMENMEQVGELAMDQSYGSPGEVSEDWKGDIYLGMMHGSDPAWSSEANSLLWVQETLKAQGVTLQAKP